MLIKSFFFSIGCKRTGVHSGRAPIRPNRERQQKTNTANEGKFRVGSYGERERERAIEEEEAGSSERRRTASPVQDVRKTTERKEGLTTIRTIATCICSASRDVGERELWRARATICQGLHLNTQMCAADEVDVPRVKKRDTRIRAEPARRRGSTNRSDKFRLPRFLLCFGIVLFFFILDFSRRFCSFFFRGLLLVCTRTPEYCLSACNVASFCTCSEGRVCACANYAPPLSRNVSKTEIVHVRRNGEKGTYALKTENGQRGIQKRKRKKGKA